MTKELIRPNWYCEKYYNKIRTPEEWLHEIWKRYQFSQDKIGISQSIYNLPINEQASLFIEFIFDKEIEKYLIHLNANPPQPVKYPSITDICLMYHLLIKSDLYKDNPNLENFENAIHSIINKEVLSLEQKHAFHEMNSIPWCNFYENHKLENWSPKNEEEYLTGIPLIIDPVYAKKDAISILKNKLNSSVGKLQGIEFQFDSWQERKILAVFDLNFWFKMHGIKVTNIGIHKLIWPKDRVSNSSQEGVNPEDDIKHSLKLVKAIIDRSVLSTLITYCEARKFKKETSLD